MRFVINQSLRISVFILVSIATLSIPAHSVHLSNDKIINASDDDGEILDYIVRFKDGSSYENFISNEVKAMSVVSSLPFMSTEVLKFQSADTALEWIASRKDIAIMEKDGKVHALEENIPFGIKMVDAFDIGDYVEGSDIKACIIDTGYDHGHEDLQKNNLSGSGTCNDDTCNWFEDGNSHGTHVAGTMIALGGNGKGVAGVVRSGKMPIRIERALGSNGSGTWSGVLQSMKNCVTAGAKVVNMSLGGGFSQTLASYIRDLEDSGTDVLFVAAAGNMGDNTYSYPASLDSPIMMSVACVDSYSNRCYFSQYNDQVDIAAPGYGVISTMPENSYSSKSGTSMSSPHVAAVAALIWSHYPRKSSAEIRRALETSATQPDKSQQGSRNDEFGWGIVNAKLALEALSNPSPTTSPVASPTPMPSNRLLTNAPTQSPTLSAQPSGPCMPLKILIRPDGFASEISWELLNPHGRVVTSSQEQEELGDHTLYELELCIATSCDWDSNFKFNIYDSHGDGIGPWGWYELYVRGHLITRGSSYTKKETTKFSSCIFNYPTTAPTSSPTMSKPTAPCRDLSIEIYPDKFASEISWDLVNYDGDLIASLSDKLTPWVLYSAHVCVPIICPNSHGYIFTIYDAYGDGLTNGGYFKVFLEGKMIDEGREGYSSVQVKVETCNKRNVPSSLAPTVKPTISPTVSPTAVATAVPTSACQVTTDIQCFFDEEKTRPCGEYVPPAAANECQAVPMTFVFYYCNKNKDALIDVNEVRSFITIATIDYKNVLDTTDMYPNTCRSYEKRVNINTCGKLNVPASIRFMGRETMTSNKGDFCFDYGFKKFKFPKLEPPQSPATSSPTQKKSTCQDNSFFRKDGEALKSCDWIGRDAQRLLNNCSSPDVQQNCPQTCKLCCSDDLNYILLTKLGTEKRCVWLKRKQERRDRYCQEINNGALVEIKCAVSCGRCSPP